MLGVVAVAGFALPTERYDVAPESRLWIDGTATTGAWTCAADAVAGSGQLGDALAGAVTVPVRDFDCGSRAMNADLRGALRADAHPQIRFDLEAAEALSPEARPGAWVPVRAVGTLRLAGAARRVTVTAEGRRMPGGRVALRGRHTLRMTDFGVTPPSRALGLVRAHDAIAVRFDLRAAAR